MCGFIHIVGNGGGMCNGGGCAGLAVVVVICVVAKTLEGPFELFVAVLSGSIDGVVAVGSLGCTPLQAKHKHMSCSSFVGLTVFIHDKCLEKKHSPLSSGSISVCVWKWSVESCCCCKRVDVRELRMIEITYHSLPRGRHLFPSVLICQ